MKKSKLYAIVLSSLMFASTGAYAINEGFGGGRGQSGLDAGSGGQRSGGMGPSSQMFIENEWSGCGDKPTTPPPPVSESTPERDHMGMDLNSDEDPAMRQDTGNEERGSNVGIAGDRATGSPERALGHHSNSFTPGQGYGGRNVGINAKD